MQLPIWILTIATLLFGVFPGIAMSLIAKIQASFGLAVVPYSLHGIQASAGQLNMLVVSLTFAGGLVVAYIVYLLGSKRKHVNQYDNYAAGNFLDKNVPYNFNYHFYAAFEHIMEPYRKKVIDRTEKSFVSLAQATGDYLRRLYTGNVSTYAIYVLSAFVITAILLARLF